MAQIVSQDNLILQRRKWKDNGQCVVFVSGCFDLLHPGHIRLLEQAHSHGDILIVGVQSDASVQSGRARLGGSEGSTGFFVGKFPGPITPGIERAEILAALAAVDYVVEFNEPSPERLIGCLSPDIIVEGASSRPGLPKTAEGPLAGESKAKVVTILLEPGYSTKLLIERITQAGS